MTLLNNNRLSHWFAAAVLVWTALLFFLFIPTFHWLLGFSIVKIAASAGIGCAVQLAVTPWFLSARPTDQNPSGNVTQRAIAAIVWSSLSALLFFYYISRNWPNDVHARQFRDILFGTTIVFGVVCLIIVGLISRKRGRL